MPVDISDILHVLAHELRTPIGIAQGYARMLLEERLPEPADRRRALEQMQKALARVGELSHETSALANWYGTGRDAIVHLNPAMLVHHVEQQIARDSTTAVMHADVTSESRGVRSFDDTTLASAIGAMIRATARELRSAPCVVRVRACGEEFLEWLAGAEEHLPALAQGPDAPGATEIALERGGLGLAFVHAVAVLTAHDAEPWTVDGSRQIVGIRLPLQIKG